MTKASTEERALRVANELARAQAREAKRERRQERRAEKARAQEPSEQHLAVAEDVLRRLRALRDRRELFARGHDAEVPLYTRQRFFDSSHSLVVDPEGQVRYRISGAMGWQAWPMDTARELADRVSLDTLEELAAKGGEGIWKKIEGGLSAWLKAFK